MAQIGIHLNGKPYRATVSLFSGQVSWCSEEVVNQLGVKIAPLAKPLKGHAPLMLEILFIGTVTPLIELSPGVRLTDFPLLVGKCEAYNGLDMVCLAMDLLRRFPGFDCNRRGLYLNGMPHWWLQMEEEKITTGENGARIHHIRPSPTIIHMEELNLNDANVLDGQRNAQAEDNDIPHTGPSNNKKKDMNKKKNNAGGK